MLKLLGKMPKAGQGSRTRRENNRWLDSLWRATHDVAKEGCKVLDFGCCVGRYALRLSANVSRFTYWGLEQRTDHGERSIEKARSWIAPDDRVHFGFVDGFLENSAINNADFAILGSVITHTSRRQAIKVLERLSPILYRGGTINFDMFHNYEGTGTQYIDSSGYGTGFHYVYHDDTFLKDVAEFAEVLPLGFTHDRHVFYRLKKKE